MNMQTVNKTEGAKSAKPVAMAHPELEQTTPKSKKPMMITIGSIVAVLVALGLFQWWRYASSVEETDDAVIVGRIHQLSSRISGTVKNLYVQDNQHVKQGDVLLEIDPRDYQISADTAQAAASQAKWKAVEAQSSIVVNERKSAAEQLTAESAIASAKAQVDRAKASLIEAKQGVSMAKSQIKQREAELTRCVADYDRYKSLVEDRAATMQNFDKAKQDKDVAEANLQVAKEGLNQAESRVQEAIQSVADAQAGVIRAKSAAQNAAAARAETEMAKKTLVVQESAAAKAKSEFDNSMTQLSYTNVVAPISGNIGHRTVEVGQQIERGQSLMSIVSDEKWVVANFKETQLSRMHAGQKVDIQIDAFPGKAFTGRVDSVSPASGAQFALLPPDNATGNFTKVVQRVSVKIVLDPQSINGYESRLTPGMSVIPVVHVSK
jgi:membrane fusion protein (multidrug efflux system)